MMTSNLGDLEAHIKNKFQNMFKSEEIHGAGKEVHETLYKNVDKRLRTSTYDYNQSGDFREAMQEESRNYDAQIGRSSIKVGFGYIEEGGGLNDPLYMRQEQTATFLTDSKNNKVVSLRLRAEKQMPKWIVLEFGTRDRADKMPASFKVSYTRRDKQNMIGPSLRAPSGHSKSVFAMVSDKGLGRIFGNNVKPHRHRGTKGGRFFRKGLEDSKEDIQGIYGRAIQEYLNK